MQQLMLLLREAEEVETSSKDDRLSYRIHKVAIISIVLMLCPTVVHQHHQGCQASTLFCSHCTAVLISVQLLKGSKDDTKDDEYLHSIFKHIPSTESILDGLCA
jgi:hypothetical protein